MWPYEQNCDDYVNDNNKMAHNDVNFKKKDTGSNYKNKQQSWAPFFQLAISRHVKFL